LSCSLTSGLFDSETRCSLENVKFIDIEVYSKALINIIYNDIFLDNIEIENVNCIGDKRDTSFLLFDSGDANKKLHINGLNVKNCRLNGSLIKIKGNYNELELNNLNINDVISYGPILENLSENVL